MEKLKLHKLLSRYLSKTLVASEWDELKVLLEKNDDATVLDVLQIVWEEEAYVQKDRLFEPELEKIFANIRRFADPAASAEEHPERTSDSSIELSARTADSSIELSERASDFPIEKPARTSDFPMETLNDTADFPIELSDRKRLVSSDRFRQVLKVAGVLLVLVMVGLSGYFYRDRELMTHLGEKEITVNAPKGQQVIVTLPDSSVVHLNSESTLSYRQDFGYKNRNVYLEGEAFFEVRKDAISNFTINTEHLKAEVLGTRFNFYTYANEQVVELALVTGSVRIETKHHPVKQQLYLKPDEKMVYDKKTGNFNLEHANIPDETAWLRGELVFRSELIRDVLYKIERKYGVNIVVVGEVFQYDRFTGSFAGNEIRQVMDELKAHYGFVYRIEGADIWIEPENREK